MLEKILRFKLTGAVFLLSLIFVLGGWLWAYGALRKTAQPLIIHFNNLAGINQIGSIWDLNGIGFLGVVAVLINFFIALELEERDWFWGKLLASATLFLSILIFIGFAAIISVN